MPGVGGGRYYGGHRGPEVNSQLWEYGFAIPRFIGGFVRLWVSPTRRRSDNQAQRQRRQERVVADSVIAQFALCDDGDQKHRRAHAEL